MRRGDVLLPVYLDLVLDGFGDDAPDGGAYLLRSVVPVALAGFAEEGVGGAEDLDRSVLFFLGICILIIVLFGLIESGVEVRLHPRTTQHRFRVVFELLIILVVASSDRVHLLVEARQCTQAAVVLTPQDLRQLVQSRVHLLARVRSHAYTRSYNQG